MSGVRPSTAPVEIRNRSAELAAIAALFIVAVVATPAVVALSAGLPVGYAWTRPLTLDEFHTLLLIEEPTFRSLVSKLAQGGDYNPPGLFLLLRPWTAVFGASEAALRAFSTVAMAVGLLGLYVALRRGVSRWTALAATLAVWGGMPLLQVEAVNARFYALWFAETAWLAALIPAMSERGGVGRTITVAGLSMLVCLTHYFGIFSLIALAAGQFFADQLGSRSLGRSLLRLTPTFAGPAALALCIPLYFGQRAALEVPTWIAPSGRAAIEQLIDPFFRSITLAAAALLLVASLIWRSIHSETAIPENRVTIRPMSAALGLLGLPVILLAFHFIVQPISVARYAIPTAIGIAAACALLLSCCERRLMVVAIVGFVLLPVATLRLESDVWAADRHSAPAQLARRLAPQLRSGKPLVFAGRGDGYSAWRYSGLPDDAIRLAYPDGDENVSVFVRLERSVARRMNRLFNTPAVLSDDELLDGGPFVFFATLARCELERRFPNATVRPLMEQVSLTAYLVTPQ